MAVPRARAHQICRSAVAAYSQSATTSSPAKPTASLLAAAASPSHHRAVPSPAMSVAVAAPTSPPALTTALIPFDPAPSPRA
ncbi:hypothetical protein M0R45_019449 [Rubus argutus]|uniref:Uncharacterized protein n=1 Tax=Rubus argutus TaxID=59490 RepID=A0AAW1X688_RUBAR